MALFQMRDAHLQAFDRAAFAQFVNKASAYLRAELPEETKHLTADGMHRLVSDAVEKAQKYDLESEHAVCRFAHIRLLLGDEFAADPANQIICDLLTGEPDEDGEFDDDNDRADAALEFAQERLLPKPPPAIDE